MFDDDQSLALEDRGKFEPCAGSGELGMVLDVWSVQGCCQSIYGRIDQY
jgi:hypothetical protein